MVVTQYAGFLDPTEPLHDPDGLLNPCLALQFACARVSRRKVTVPAQPILWQMTSERQRSRETEKLLTGRAARRHHG